MADKKASRKENMEAFDVLPKEVREALAESWNNWDAFQIHEMLSGRASIEQIFQMIKASDSLVEQKFWHKIDGTKPERPRFGYDLRPEELESGVVGERRL